MKKTLLITLLAIAFKFSSAQTINCTGMCVLGMTLDTALDNLHVTIYNGDTNHVNYPTVVVTNATGDTVGNINNTFYFFAHPAGDTVTHVIPSTLTSLPSNFTGTVYFTDQIWDITCMFSYPMNCSVGINEYAARDGFSLYPNPARDQFSINLNLQDITNAEIIIRDIMGKRINRYSVENNQMLINCADLNSGMYFISVISKEKSFTKKLVIK
jgi:hypothetical protein